jgi:hypothetical protein
MKYFKIMLTMLFFALFFDLMNAQIPNNSFENWTEGNPDDWTTNNNVPSLFTPVTQVADPHSGSSAARMEIKGTFFPIPPILKAGINGTGIPVTQRYVSLSGYYKNFPTTVNTYFVVLVGMFKSNQLVGQGMFSTKNGNPFYTNFSIQISYFDSQIPDTASIYITVIDSTNSILSSGGYAIVDDINFDPPSDIGVESGLISDFKLGQNYPNPFNPTTKLSFVIGHSSLVTLKVYDILGRVIATLVNEKINAGKYEVIFDGSGLSSGVYFYRLNAGQYTNTKKFILMK